MPTVPARIRPRHTYCGAVIVSRRKTRPSRTTRTMLAPAHTALARDAGTVRVAKEKRTNPTSSARIPPNSGPGRSKPCALPSSTTPVTSATTVTTRKTMPLGGATDRRRFGSAGEAPVESPGRRGHRVTDDGGEPLLDLVGHRSGDRL